MSDDFDDTERARRFTGAGGTSGGGLEFVIGLVLIIAGAYMVMRHVTVYSGYWGWFGNSTFGATLIPLLFGLGVLFFNGRSMLGWLLAGGGLVIIFAGILMNLSVNFAPTDLFTTLVMFGMMAIGLGLVARAVRTH